jgi:hypothetical protein
MRIQVTARDKQINFLVSEAEAARFDTVATHLGLSLASMIRQLVREKSQEMKGTVDAPALDEDELYASACLMTKRRAERNANPFVIPSRSTSGLEKKGGRTYFVLRNSSADVSRFKVTPSGALRLLKM